MKKRIYIVLSFMLALLLTACGARTTAEQTSTPSAAAGEAVVDAADADPGQEEEAEDLPEDTSMRRAFKKHLLAGGKTGAALGILVFDGEKLL